MFYVGMPAGVGGLRRAMAWRKYKVGCSDAFERGYKFGLCVSLEQQ